MMKTHYSKTLALAILFAAFGLRSTFADLEEVSFVSGANDGLLTVDTVTGLERLDLTAADGLSINGAQATEFVEEFGFRVATADEVDRLFESAGVSPNSFAAETKGLQRISYFSGFSSGDLNARSAYLVLLEKLGETAQSTGVSGSTPTSNSEICGRFLRLDDTSEVGFASARLSTFGNVSTYVIDYHVDWDPDGLDSVDQDQCLSCP